MGTTAQNIKTAIEVLNLDNKVIFAHCAMRSFGGFEGGADSLLDAFLSAGCTVVAPTFTYFPMCHSPDGIEYAQNGYRGELEIDPSPYDAYANDIEPSMGAFAKAVLNHPKRIRTEHPMNSYAAVGPLAEAVLAPQDDFNVYGVYQSPQARNAVVLSIGVTPNSITPIHYAEQLAGKALFRRWAQTAQRGVVETCVGSCSEGFIYLQPYLSPIQTKKLVGESTWTAYPLEALLHACTQAFRTNPSVTRCSDDCPRCEDMTLGGVKTLN
ncbi:AAC(3) family N-acetyltransferase [Grimontia kaedaensis]|uniref:Aminoglycoside N(3)-acetyltransferase n=1 Tax=Grimontia kaedaensis TaxID=2872157 RepID=A0ABY4X0C3_9GAMM|nr:AAC(3) family N-acetyltransferase [Grimontia kaedaensis]USH04696.1 AAC(3) family N-acetyltransferase [Grimontia kaedaensis]